MRKFTCYIKPGPGETVLADLTLPEEHWGIITGTVRDPQGKPEEQALLTLRDQDGNTLFTSLTDEHGAYRFGPLLPDTLYTLEVQKDSTVIRKVEL